jgi:hypothetical protein
MEESSVISKIKDIVETIKEGAIVCSKENFTETVS